MTENFAQSRSCKSTQRSQRNRTQPDGTTIITLNNLILILHTNRNKDGGTHQTIEIQTTPKEVNKK